jgi:hypothetical protein
LDRIYKRKRKSSAKVPAVSSFDDHPALRVKKNNCKGFAERCATSPWASHSFARSVCGLGVTSCLVTRSNQETRQDVPSWISLRLPLFKANQEIDINVFCVVLQGSHHERQIWGAKSLAGFQGVLGPLVRFLATSWGIPRSSIKCFYRAREAGRGCRERWLKF